MESCALKWKNSVIKGNTQYAITEHALISTLHFEFFKEAYLCVEHAKPHANGHTNTEGKRFFSHNNEI